MGLHDFNLYDVIVRNARIFPTREAFVFDRQRLTFGQFQSQVDRLASGLKKIGLIKGDRIGILSQNCLEFVLLYGAAAKTGAILLPINWRLAPQEVEYILADGRPRIFFAGPEYVSLAKEMAGKLGFMEKLLTSGTGGEPGFTAVADLFGNADPLPEADLSPNDPYLIIHTAAVAGKPRGATLSQGNILAANLQQMSLMGLGENDAYLHLLPLFHIADLAAAFAVMHAGGKNVLMDKFDPETALHLMERERITVIGEFPPMLGMLLEKMEGKTFDLSSLKTVIGIDRSSNIEKFNKKAKAEFWIGFGQSETSGLVTLCRFSEKPGSAGKVGPLAKVKLVDEHDREVEAGKPGEICVQGPLVFLGYWNLPEDNHYTFREGWHHTGDIGRLDENGYLWYLKRKAEKELIKPGGENVYPAEVEKAILEHPQVAEVSVIGVRDREWGEAVKAICVLKPGSSLTGEELIAFVASKIARFKKPKFVEYIPALPKTQDGTLDRDKIKAEYGKA